jgi:hypothetical protein
MGTTHTAMDAFRGTEQGSRIQRLTESWFTNCTDLGSFPGSPAHGRKFFLFCTPTVSTPAVREKTHPPCPHRPGCASGKLPRGSDTVRVGEGLRWVSTPPKTPSTARVCFGCAGTPLVSDDLWDNDGFLDFGSWGGCLGNRNGTAKVYVVTL